MDLNKLEQEISDLINHLSKDEFIYKLLLAYEFPKATITRLKRGDYNQSNNRDESHQEILWKKKLFFKVEEDKDLHLAIDLAQKDPAILKQHPRFIIITDFKTVLAMDTKVGDTLDVSLRELSENYTFFLPWAGMEKTQIESLNLADIKAAEKLAQLYDIIIKENHIETDTERHGLNIFLSRLLFCFFAEDTGIFDDDQFTNAIASHTNDDGTDLQDYLIALFKVMNTDDKQRSNEPAHVKAFPYVNGGLFAVDYPAPKLNAKARKMIINAGTLNWKQINPDIFGSMMQAVVHSDQRGSLGMHYTSVANIMKGIEPLFLNDLKTCLKDIIVSEKGIENKLTKLLDRLYHLRLFDPACGSGNFLIIAYKELCKIEIEIFKQLQEISSKWDIARSGIQLTQFYGIELDDFAHETAKLSLWLAEHQMNLAFKAVFGSAKPTLPLQEGGHIVCGNATQLNWEEVCPKEKEVEIYILGNPPYLGARNQSKEQKEDVRIVLKGIKGVNSLDYIACWFLKSAKYISSTSNKCGFVSTNSICQGEQISLFWPHIFEYEVEIGFAHQSFKWTNNAKGNAGVTCIVVALQKKSLADKYIYHEGLTRKVKNISPYITGTKTIFIHKRSKPLSKIPLMAFGNQPIEGGFLKINEPEYNSIVDICPEAEKYIRKLIGGSEFLRGHKRWCIWIEDKNLSNALKLKPIKERINKVKLFREEGGEVARSLVERSHQFRYRHEAEKTFIFLPRTSLEIREYIPAGFFESEYISLESAQIIYDPEPWIFSIISSRIHMTWVRAVAGRLKTDYRYSSALCYNTFPFPEISDTQKNTLEDHVFSVLDEREKHPEKTMAELYDPDKMPAGLRQAHSEMDLAVEQCYRKQPFKRDEERLEYLFKLYEKMIEAEKQQ